VDDPITDTWASVSPPTGWLNTGDAQSEMLPTASGSVWTTGRFMLAHPFSDGSSGSTGMDDALYNTNGTWTKIPGTGKLDVNDEEGWTLLPNDRVLTVDIEHNWNGTYGGTCSPCTSELFNPLNDTWSASGNVPVDLPSYVGPNGPSQEMGPVVMQPTGLAFAIGGNDATATYNSATGTWTAGPTLPGNQDSADGAASILPDGNVLFDASPGVFNSPTHFFVWNGSNITQVADTAEASFDSSYVTRFVVLPTGQVMFDDGTGDIEIFNADQTANSSWAPTITSISSTTLKGGSTYSLEGTQLSGRSDGAAYGDDNQSATNYPLVRITNNATHVVTYARTGGFSYAIASGAHSATSFTLPSSTPLGASTLQAVANGIPSAGQAVNITAPPTTSILFPSNGATVSGTTTLDASASNATSVEFWLAGGSYGYGKMIGTATFTAYGWVYSWNTTPVPNGSYALFSEALGPGGSAFSSHLSITVKN
jgi:Bacterial Ig domain